MNLALPRVEISKIDGSLSRNINVISFWTCVMLASRINILWNAAITTFMDALLVRQEMLLKGSLESFG